MIKLFLSILLLIIILPGCSTKETEKNNIHRLHDIWALESIDGEKIEMDKSIRNLPMIEIYVKEEKVHGNTSCNVINGKVQFDDNKITFSNIIATEMACPGDIEQRFLSALKSVDNYKIEKLRLYLYENEKERMLYRKID
jgi:heat shock protein HslJ